MPVLIGLGVLSLVYWNVTEAQGEGDLRYYGLVQFYPIVALPLILWLFPKAVTRLDPISYGSSFGMRSQRR